MKIKNKLFLPSVTVFILLIFFTGYFLYINNTLSSSEWTSFLYGILLTSINFYAGIISLIIAMKLSEKRFLIILYGGILLRMLLMLSAVYIILKFLQIKRDVFIFVIFGFYSFYLITEIFYFYLVKGRDN